MINEFLKLFTAIHTKYMNEISFECEEQFRFHQQDFVVFAEPP